MTVCSKCGTKKAEEEFSWKVAGVRRATICKECHRLYRQQHYQNNRQKYIDKAAKWKFGRYGLTKEQYDAMLAKHDGKCWICKEREANCIDHDHTCCPKDKSCGKCVASGATQCLDMLRIELTFYRVACYT